MTLKVRHFSNLIGGMLLSAALAATACADGDANASTSDSGTAKSSRTDREAAKLIQAQIDQRWLKGPDGWTTQVRPAERTETGWPPQREPVVLFEQYRLLEFSIKPLPVSDADRLNGIDYKALAVFKDTPRRVFRRIPEYDGSAPKGWSPWEDESFTFTSVWVVRENGEWTIGTRDRVGLDLSDFSSTVKPEASSVPPGK